MEKTRSNWGHPLKGTWSIGLQHDLNDNMTRRAVSGGITLEGFRAEIEKRAVNARRPRKGRPKK